MLIFLLLDIAHVHFYKKNLQIQKSEINVKEEKKILVLKSVLYFNVDFLISTGTKIQWHIYPLLKNNCS